MTIPENDIGILNALVSATADSAEAYREAAAHLKDEDLRTVFLRRATERNIITTHLLEQLGALGGSPEAGTATASAHRVFNDLPAAARGDRSALVNEVKRGEKQIRALYQEAVDNGALSALSLPAVRSAFHSVLAGIDDTGRAEPAARAGE